MVYLTCLQPVIAMFDIQLAALLILSSVLKHAWSQDVTTPGLEGVDGAKASGPYLKDEPPPLPEENYKKFELEPPWFIIQQKLSWSESLEACEKLDAHLAVLPNIEMAQKLVESIYEKSEKPEIVNAAPPNTIEFGTSRRYWIALTDLISEKSWLWVGLGTPLDYEFWYGGQPDHNMGNREPEHCGSLWNPGYYAKENNKHTFNDAPCSKRYYPICDSTDDLKSYLKPPK